MNCHEFESLLNDYSNTTPDDRTQQAMHVHIDKCECCASSMRLHKRYRETLRTLSVPPLNSQKREALLAGLNKPSETTRSSSGSFAVGFIAASVLAIAVFLSQQFQHSHQQAELLALLDEDENLSQEITLVINVTSDMPNAELRLNLPEDISVSGFDHLAEVSLPVNLKKGVNTIIIPVQLEHFALYADKVVVDASLIYKNSKKDFAFDLDEFLDQYSPQVDSDGLIFDSSDNKHKTNIAV